MKIIVDSLTAKNKAFDTDTAEPLDFGAEGTIYKLPAECLAVPVQNQPLVKIYADNLPNMAARQGKGIILAGKYSSFAACFHNPDAFSAAQFAFPQHNAVYAATNEYAGFSMQDLGRCPKLDGFRYENGRITDYDTGAVMTDAEAVNLFYNMAYGIDILHRNKIILGDLNDRNILYDTDRKMPLFVDIDSAQVEGYTCDAFTPTMLDPLITRKRLDGSSERSGAYEYSENSDIFALAVIAYRLLTGFHPAFFRGRGSKGTDGNTKAKLFMLRFMLDKNFEGSSGIELLDNSEHAQRLLQLKADFPEIYAHFVDVFVHDKRPLITAKLPVSDFRNPDYADYHENLFAVNDEDEDTSQPENIPEEIGGFHVGTWINTAKKVQAALKIRHDDRKGDSPAFRNFVGRIGYDYAELLSGVI